MLFITLDLCYCYVIRHSQHAQLFETQCGRLTLPVFLVSCHSLSDSVICSVCTLDYFKLSADVFHVIPSTHSAVTGIAVLKDRIYVSRSGTPQVAVYCPETFQLKVLTCGDMRHHDCAQIRRIAACNANNCLYVSEHSTHYINRVDGDSYASSRWFDGGNPQGLSITSSHNVLAALHDDNSLCEYSTSGEVIRKISLQPAGITRPL